ncbi:hypothetical protein GE061_007030 [Apolygus lucorum]|uniref:Major facilitator superfamily (MFS) profile domain-containing protein n=1 Tax=Apolygus lucorum TaxID=248454 RepID=A0A6A4IQE2_APOLU|nr:hypothetical protein GE061_007030 [Apolygus lucorum]
MSQTGKSGGARMSKSTLGSLSLNMSILISESEEDCSPEWYVLFLYCITSFCQVVVWNTWSPIANSALYAYPSWKESTIALLNNWSSITFLLFIMPSCWLLNSRGLRPAFVIATFLCVIGTGIRLIPADDDTFTSLAHMGSILNSIGGVTLSPAIVLLSSTWFPPNQRTSATGIGTSLSLLGIAGSYILGPTLVSEPLGPTDEDRQTVRNEIDVLLLISFLLELFLFDLVFFTFPIQPQRPASRSAILRGSVETDFFSEVVQTAKNKSFWVLALASGLCSGITGPWLSLLTIIFAQTGITQSETAKLGFWTIVCSCLLGLSVSRASDAFQGHLKPILMLMIAFGDFMFLWIVLITTNIVPFNKGSLAVVVIGGLSSIWSTPALFYELGAEITFPIQEGIVAGCMMAVNNMCACLVYLQLYIFPSIDVSWMNYGLFVFGLMSLTLLSFVKETYNRLALDVT